MDKQLKKKEVIHEINSYFLEKGPIHNTQASNLLIKIDPKFRGLFFNARVLKRLKKEINVLMRTIAFDFSQFLENTCCAYDIETSTVDSIARSMLKKHQKLIIQNLLSSIRQKNPKMADELNIRLDEFPNIVLPFIRKNNTEIFSRVKPRLTILAKVKSLFGLTSHR